MSEDEYWDWVGLGWFWFGCDGIWICLMFFMVSV